MQPQSSFCNFCVSARGSRSLRESPTSLGRVKGFLEGCSSAVPAESPSCSPHLRPQPGVAGFAPHLPPARPLELIPPSHESPRSGQQLGRQARGALSLSAPPVSCGSWAWGKPLHGWFFKRGASGSPLSCLSCPVDIQGL